ncbi:MAG: hypothetical protein R3C09_15385 [Pirellulaceae bacterium]
MQCPLGGTYQFQPQSSQSQASASATASKGGWWTSTAWSEATFDNRGKPVPPPSYSAPWIDWFRGGKVHVTQGADSLALVGSIELEMQPLAVQHDPQLPSMLPTMNFDLFSLPSQLFGKKDKADEKPTTQSF